MRLEEDGHGVKSLCLAYAMFVRVFLVAFALAWSARGAEQSSERGAGEGNGGDGAEQRSMCEEGRKGRVIEWGEGGGEEGTRGAFCPRSSLCAVAPHLGWPIPGSHGSRESEESIFVVPPLCVRSIESRVMDVSDCHHVAGFTVLSQGLSSTSGGDLFDVKAFKICEWVARIR